MHPPCSFLIASTFLKVGDIRATTTIMAVISFISSVVIPRLEFRLIRSTMAIMITVHNGTDNRTGQTVEIGPFGKQHLTNNHSSQTDNDGSHTHLHISKALILGDQPAGHGHKAVTNHKADNDHRLCIGTHSFHHIRVIAGGTQGTADFRTEKAVDQHNEDNGKNDTYHKAAPFGWNPQIFYLGENSFPN